MIQMKDNSYVVVFPSIFSHNRLSMLIDNIKKILKIKNLEYQTIRKDCNIVIIKANDPVFASSAINLLFGVKKVAIAKQVENEFNVVASEISKIGSNLLLKGDSFYVKVDGFSKGFIPKDLEMAATSAIIEKASKMGTHPGTEEKHEKLLYTYLTKSNAYVCIFSDNGLGGIPYGSQKKDILCCIFDELSAVSCLETIKQGFNVKIIICYTKKSEIINLVKMINQIIPRMVTTNIELEFYKIKLTENSIKNYFLFFQVVLGLLQKIAKKKKINHISLPVSPLIFPSDLIDEYILSSNKQKLIVYFPLGALEDEIFKNAHEIGLGKFLPSIEKLVKKQFTKTKFSEKSIQKDIKNSIKTIEKISIKVGPNNVHDILDSLGQEHRI